MDNDEIKNTIGNFLCLLYYKLTNIYIIKIQNERDRNDYIIEQIFKHNFKNIFYEKVMLENIDHYDYLEELKYLLI